MVLKRTNKYIWITLIVLCLIVSSETFGEQWGPLITTNWYQSGRYNNKCPYAIPYIPGLRRPVGCVATATAQIINYWKFPLEVSFNSQSWPDGDAYTENGISFDADASKYGFPTFADLESALSVINYDDDDEEVAYLNFATGIELQMSYGVTGSGASTHDVAHRVRNGFSFGSATARSKNAGLWNEYRSVAIENIKAGRPVQIGIHKSNSWDGHSVIVDGYRDSDGYFHVNFGWELNVGTGWYDLPNSYGSYDVVHTIVYDICSSQGWNQYGADEKNTFRPKYPVPTEEPERKWSRSIPGGFDRYTYNGTLVVGDGGNIYAALSSMDQGQNNHPYIHIINREGTQLGLPSISDSDYTINSLAQNRHGDVYFGCGYGTYNTHDKTIIYRIASGTTQPVPIFTHTSPDPGWPDEVMKIDQSDNIYFMISPNLSPNGSKIYSCDRYGNLRWQRYLGINNKVYGSFPAIDYGRGQVYVIYKNSDTNQSFFIAINNMEL